ncbi:cytochrome C oxidase subunit IV family protein [Nocardioides sp. WS12]|uniref:cytochrome C oxidase subunit IV family protein n=1 Tax=Nocardioides sp. WS12 TaxID=2486272 RepID=UPI0015FCCF5E|nr:cytochrome C oxidase subunit IV family protein [Nocardioides sp. WS12]
MLRHRATVTWLGLVILTCATTWGMSTDSLDPGLAVVGTFVIAAAKVALVMREFMELRLGPWQVRAVFGTWIVAVTTIILAFWFASPHAT